VKPLDRFLQRWRIAKVKPLIPQGARVLDIGCGDGALFKQLGSQLSGGLGLDPTLEREETMGNFKLSKGHFPESIPEGDKFDAITLLAVFEHIPEAEQRPFAEHCVRLLKPGGRVLVTVPAPLVDKILDVLMAVKLLDGMEVDEHYGFKPEQTPGVFNVPGLSLIKASKFQLGLNNLFAFEKRA
jgi:2-polyprenyl-3-methyl-5-hydroxy-6-metoxy-1,4-benzoquinol methylase